MRNMSTALLNFLNSATQIIQIDLFTFELKSGVTLRLCSHSAPVTFGGNTWSPAPAGLTRSNIRWATGIEVDNMDITLAADSSILVSGTPLLAAAVKGLFDNCRVTLSRLFLSDFNTPVDTLMLFQGNSAPARVVRTVMNLSVKSDLESLNRMIPPNVYQSSCMHTLFDIGCTVNAATYRVTGTISGVNANGSLQTALGQAAGWFQTGSIKFTAGPNAGLTRTVKSFSGGAVYIANPFPYPVAAGHAFAITPGCDRLRDGDCVSKYNNIIHFKATPYIPVPETAV